MKKFLISEEEKNRILNLHENMKALDKERQLELSGKKLNEQIQPVVKNLVDNALTTGRISSRVIAALDDIIIKNKLIGKYKTPIRNGDELLDAFIAGKLSNKHADDDAVRVLKKIFSSTDDDDLIDQLAKEIVDGDLQFKRGLMDGKYDATKIYPGKQGQALQDYITSLKRPLIDPSSPLSPTRNVGNYLSGYGHVEPIDPNYVEQMLRNMFSMEPMAVKWIDENIDSLKSSIPLNQAQADRIVSKNEQLIDKMLQARGVPKSMWKGFKEDLKKNWAFKNAKGFYYSIGVGVLFVAINKLFGITALTPLKLAADGLGFTEGYEAVLSYLCDNNTPWACNAGSGGGSRGGNSDDILDPSGVK